MKVHLPRYKLTGDVNFRHYGNGQTAIVLVDAGEQLAVATVNLEELRAPDPGPNQVWVKTWAENEGMDAALIDAGVAKATGEVFVVNQYGSKAVLMDLTPAALAERASQRGDN